MDTLDCLMTEYGSHHQTKGNMMTHFVGIPLIMYGLFVLLSGIHLVGLLTGAEVLIAAALGFYFTFDWKIGTGMAIVAGALDVLARFTPFWWIGLVAFVVGWILQLVGHYAFEKKAPSFMENLTHLLVGPAFILNEVIKVRKIEQKDATHE